MFWPLFNQLKVELKKVEGGASRKEEIMEAIGKKLGHYKSPWLELKIQYGKTEKKTSYSE